VGAQNPVHLNWIFLYLTLDMFFIYILYSDTADKYYVGYSDNPQRRLYEHNNNFRNTYTKKNGTWVLKVQFLVNSQKAVLTPCQSHWKLFLIQNIVVGAQKPWLHQVLILFLR